ncbi:hypothetical protein [Flavobacterium nitrogenifigens]|uniref:Uncharacterized protein n=1 Tax=Flavobacterium nitrogenifigens TaxID=1617283 RepID=A0A521F7Q5_9FLAO|nr:hypothetical protein [Flavobacterium nitrogenifigens]KAF2337790.1 hypothetical protein DM397_03675 [Flavobacterium nitrogenifigens]SMO92193.1 hypothetical protein SAMN06265220_10726 [Flavobacterium nitrogenifigens]
MDQTNIGKKQNKSEFLDQMLIVLGSAYPRSLSFEEMAEALSSPSSSWFSSANGIENETKIMEALLELENFGLAAIDSDTDESCLTILGLQRIAAKRPI